MGFLRCTVRDAETGEQHDIEIEYQPGSTVQSLLDALPADVHGRTVYCGTVRLEPPAIMGESPLVAGCVISIGASAADPRGVPPDAAGVLRVLAGPDAGVWTWVATGGGAVVGRDDPVDLYLHDTKASRRHAEVVTDSTTGGSGVTVRDLGSLNGTKVNGIPASGATPVPEHGGFEIGDSLIQWIPLDRVATGWRQVPDGRIEFTRRFHSAPIPAPTAVSLPTPSPESARGMMMLVGSVAAPLAAGAAMWAVSGSPLFLLMGLFAPITGGVQHVVERRRRAAGKAEFGREKTRATREIAMAVAAQEQVRRLNDPDELSLTLSALGALPRLWTKRLAGPDALTVRLGARDEPAAVQLQGERWKDLPVPVLRAVPVTLDLRSTGVLGVVGDRPVVEGLARWLLVQLATRRSPEDLTLFVLSSNDGTRLSWTRWLPHLDAGDSGDAPCRVGVDAAPSLTDRVKDLRLLVEGRLAMVEDRSGQASFDSDVVVVLDGAHELRNLNGMRTILTRGPEVGVFSICLDDTDINECRGRVRVDADGRLEILRTFTDAAQSADVETTALADAERIARLLAPLRDRAHASGAGNAIPYPVRYLDLVNIHTPTSEDVLRLWNADPGPTTRIPLGADGQGRVDVDLAEQGPHTMLGGATGAGKSILLQTLVVSLLLHNRPDELNLVLVDFKGGAAFRPFKNCPQVVGLILSSGDTPEDTFDDAAAHRVLASIRAEVQRRERILSRFGGEISEFLTHRPAGSPPLPRLLMIFDEFARVLDTAPGFVKELVNVAGKGRSLGMHLLLATQSLQGKLTPEMKNNIELRISLRQNQPEESTEVLDVPVAATIPGRLKGRGVILCTKEDPPLPKPFQAGYLGAPPPTSEAPPARVRIVDWPAVGDPRPPEPPSRGDQPTDQDLLIACIEQAAVKLRLPKPFAPLRPPLPGSLFLTDIGSVATEDYPLDAIPFGLADEPARQAQPAAVLRLGTDGRLMIAGGSLSGRSTAIRTLIHSAARRWPADDLHLYVVEREPAGLDVYEDLPHCGGVFGPAEPDRLRRFVTWLGAEVDRRLAAQFSSHQPTVSLLVLIDGWEIFHDPGDSESSETTLVRIMRKVIIAGPKVGVNTVVCCGRGPLSKPGDLFGERLILPFPQDDIIRSTLPTGSMLPVAIPGRAAEAGTGRHVQIAEPGESAEELVESFAGQSPPTRGPKLFPSLPSRLSVSELESRPAPPDASPDWIPLGIGGPDVSTVGVDLFTGPQTLLISGPKDSGTDSAAGSLVLGLTAIGVGCVVLCAPRSPLREQLAGRSDVVVLTGPTLTDLVIREAAASLGTERSVVIASDCEQLTVVVTSQGYDELPTLLEEASSPEQLGRMGLVLCGNATALLDGPRRSLTGVTGRVLAEGIRILLTPTVPAAAREHRFALEADQYLAGPPGRGYLSHARDHILVQMVNAQ